MKIEELRESLHEDVKVCYETDLTNFEFWSGAQRTASVLTDDELKQISDILGETAPEGMTETQINDIFWFEDDWIAEMLGYEDFETLYDERKGNVEEAMSRSPLVEKPVYSLDTQYDSRKSFYNKAKVDTGDKGDKNKLYSYDTLVAEIVDGKPVVYGTYSATTLRHIKEWLKQLGYKADNAKQIMQDYGQMNESKSIKEEKDILSANELADKVFTALNNCNISGYGNYIDRANDSVQLYPNDKDISEEITDCLKSDFVFEIDRYGHIIVTDLKSLSESKSINEDADNWSFDKAVDWLTDVAVDQYLDSPSTEGAYRNAVGLALNHETLPAVLNTQDARKNIMQVAPKIVASKYGAKIHRNKSESINEDVITEDIDEQTRMQALAEYLNIDVEDISGFGDYSFDTPEGEYIVATEVEAHKLALDDIKNLFDDLGVDSFTPNFRQWIYDNAVDTHWFKDALYECEEAYVNDIESEDGRLEDELVDAGIVTPEDFESGDFDIDDAKQRYIDYLVDNMGDPIKFYKDNFGQNDFNRVVRDNDLVNIDIVAEEAIEWDGVAHFIATYDGKEIELGDGLFAYRTN